MHELKKTVLFCAFFCQKHVIFPLFKTFFFKTRSFCAFFCRFLSFFKPPPPFSAQKQAPPKTPNTTKHNFTHENTSFWSNYSHLLRFLALLRAIFRPPPLFLAQKRTLDLFHEPLFPPFSTQSLIPNEFLRFPPPFAHPNPPNRKTLR